MAHMTVLSFWQVAIFVFEKIDLKVLAIPPKKYLGNSFLWFIL